MSEPRVTDPARALPCGTWPSPLAPERAVAGGVGLTWAGAIDGTLYWIEGRPAERGRGVLVSRRPGSAPADAVSADADVRSRVHEYGGLPWAVLADGTRVLPRFDDQRLRVLAGSDPQAAGRLLTPPGCRYADFDRAPDGHTLLAVREDHRSPGEAVNTIVRLDPRRADDEGTVLLQGPDFVAAPRWAPDGRIACITWQHPDMPWDSTQLLVGTPGADGESVTWQTVAGGPGVSVIEPQWDADGTLYFISDAEGGWWNLWRWRGHGAPERVAALEAELAAPPWQLGQRSYALAGDGRALVMLSRGARETLAVLDLAGGGLRELPLPQVAFGSVGRLDANTGFALAAAPDAWPALVTIDLQTGAYTTVRSAGETPLDAADISRAEALRFPVPPGADGARREAHAWFYAPKLAGVTVPADERPPLIVVLHGGPTSHSPPVFKPVVQFWTTRGFAVVDVNYGGSTGFGRAYRERLNGQWGVVDLQDAIAAVDHLAAQGRIDGRRVAIRGGSAGGFTVLCGLVFSERFAAGINYFGVADLASLATDTHKFESRYLDRLVAPLPEGADVYRARSPVHHMQRCHGALLTLQGSDDRAVPPQQSRDVVAAARAAGSPVAYIEFEGEGHGFRVKANLVRALEAEWAFLARVFGFEAPAGVEEVAIENAAALRPRSERA